MESKGGRDPFYRNFRIERGSLLHGEFTGQRLRSFAIVRREMISPFPVYPSWTKKEVKQGGWRDKKDAKPDPAYRSSFSLSPFAIPLLFLPLSLPPVPGTRDRDGSWRQLTISFCRFSGIFLTHSPSLFQSRPFFSLPYDYKSAANQLTWIIFVMQNSKRTNDSVFGEKRLPPLIFLPPLLLRFDLSALGGNVSLESITISGKKEGEEERRESKLTAAKTLFRSIEKVSFKLDRS